MAAQCLKMEEPKVIYITRKIPDEGMKILKNDSRLVVKCWDSEDVCPRDELLKQVVGVDGILCTLCDNIDKELLEAAGPQLKVISTLSVGTLHINLNECKARKIIVEKSPDVASDSAAEFTVTLVLLVARRLLEGMDAVKRGEWGLWKPMWICGFEMGGRTLGIYGFGKVGFGVARRLKPFNIGRIIYHDVGPIEYAHSIEATLVDMDTLARESDILCICCAATPQTSKSVNKEFIAKMKKKAILINTARAVILDQDALDQALRKRDITAAALDITDPEPLPADHPLKSNPYCIITPHQGTATLTTRRHMAKAAASSLSILLLGRED